MSIFNKANKNGGTSLGDLMNASEYKRHVNELEQELASLRAQMTPEMQDAIKASERIKSLNHAVLYKVLHRAILCTCR